MFLAATFRRILSPERYILARGAYRYLRKAVLPLVGIEPVHWIRVVMDRETNVMVQALDPARLSVLEISGDKWRDFGFLRYESVSYPDFDVCSQALPASFDLVILEQVLEHVLWPRRALINVRAMLKPGGFALVTTPFLIRIHSGPEDCSRWSEVGLRHLLADAGFDLAEVRTGSWGSRSCLIANLRWWPPYIRWWHSLRNDSRYPLMVWAIAKKLE